MKRMKHHNKRRWPAAMLIQCLWRLEVGRRDGAKELLNIRNAQANRKSTSNSENGVTPNGRLEDQSKRILGAMYSLRKLKYLACRSSMDFTQNSQNNALRTKIVLYILFFRKRFKVTMRPHDVRDVVEAFGAGQVKK